MELTKFKKLHLVSNINLDHTVLSLLFLFSFILHTFISINYSFSPIDFLDELLYAKVALSIHNIHKLNPAISYPPIYPLIISPAYFFDHFYAVMKIINSFFISLLPIPTYFLAKTIKLKYPLLPSIAVPFLVVTIIYPQYIISENISILLFTTTALLSLSSNNKSAHYMLFGSSLAFLYLAKYLFLPAVFLFFFIKFIVIANTKDSIGLYKKYIKYIFYTLVGYLFIIFLWVLYAHFYSGFSIIKLFGVKQACGNSFHSIHYFIEWLILYTSYSWLLFFPMLATIFYSISIVKIKRSSFSLKKISNIYILMTILFLAGYIFMASFHSYTASYNYPKPQYIIGRYLVHLFPLLVILSFYAIEKISFSNEIKSHFTMFFITCILVLFSIFSYNLLFNNLIYELPKWFSSIDFNGINVNSYKNQLWIFLSYISILYVILSFFKNKNKFIFLSFVFYLYLFLSILLYFNNKKPVGIIYREVINIVKSHDFKSASIIFNIPGSYHSTIMRNVIIFFNTNTYGFSSCKPFNVIQINKLNIKSLKKNIIYVSNRKLSVNTSLKSINNSQIFFIYTFKKNKLSLVNTKLIKAGITKNKVVWIITKNFKRGNKVFVNNIRIKNIAIGNNLISFSIKHLMINSRILHIRIIDALTKDIKTITVKEY